MVVLLVVGRVLQVSAVCLELRDSQDQLVFQDQKDPTEMPVKKALR